MIRLDLQMFAKGSSGDGLSAYKPSQKIDKKEFQESNDENLLYIKGERYPMLKHYGYEYYPKEVDKLEKGENYFVMKYKTNGQSSEYGDLSYDEVKELLKGFKYENNGFINGWYSKRGFVSYSLFKRKKK